MSKSARRSRTPARRGTQIAGRRPARTGQEEFLSRHVLQSAQFVFLIETVLNTAVFLTIAGVAVGLSELVDLMTVRRFNSVIVFFVQIAEYLLFFCDMLWFVVFLGISTYRALVDIIRRA